MNDYRQRYFNELGSKSEMMAECVYCGSNRTMKQERVSNKIHESLKSIKICRSCNQTKLGKNIRFFLIEIYENDKYRWNRIVRHNKGKRSQIARQVRMIRDSRTIKNYKWTNDYKKISTSRNTKLAKWKEARKKKWKTFYFKGVRYTTSELTIDSYTKRLRKKRK